MSTLIRAPRPCRAGTDEISHPWHPKIYIPLLALLATFIVAASASARINGLAGAPQLMVESAGPSTWLARETPPETPGQLQAWTVLRQRPDSPLGNAWLPIASLPESPTHVAHLGERFAALFSDGTWMLVSSGGQLNGPSLPEGFRAIAMCDAADGRLAFVGRGATGGLFRFDFDGAKFVRGPAIAFDPGALAQMQLVDAPTGLIIAAEHDGAIDIRDTFASGTLLARFNDVDHVRLLVDGSSVVVLTRHDKIFHAAWLADRILSDPSTISVTPPIGTAATFSMLENSIVAWWIADGKVFEQRFARSGQPLAAAAPIELMQANVPPLFERVLYIVGAATLIVVLLVGGRQKIGAVVGGRGAVREASRAVLPIPAPLARRLAAGLIDLTPLIAASTYLVMRGSLTSFAGTLRFDSYTSEAILSASVVFYIALIAAFEFKWKRSIGKMALALRVVSVDNRLPAPRAILIRNLLRLVDLNLVTLLVVPLTPMRQRLGDFLAGTTVVDAADAFSGSRETPDDLADK